MTQVPHTFNNLGSVDFTTMCVKCWKWDKCVQRGDILKKNLKMNKFYIWNSDFFEGRFSCTGTIRLVHTMPCGRMQHIAALLRGKSCSAYAASLNASTLKNHFLLTIFQVTKPVELTMKTQPAFFYPTGWCNFETLYSSYAVPKITSTLHLMANIGTANLWWDWYFADQIFMPQHTEALPKQHRTDVHIILSICRAARPHF